MPDFAAWLHELQTTDAYINALKTFATGEAARWPYWSNNLSDYRQVILATSPAPANRDDLITGLGVAFERWRNTQQAATNPLYLKGGGKWLISIGLVAFALVIIYALHSTDFYPSLGKPDQVRGLITFIFTFTAMAVIMLVAVAIFWIKDAAEVKERYPSAKDLLAILVGILGTILGFYFGSADRTSGTPPTIANLTIAAPANNNMKVTGTASGGTTPYFVSVTFDPNPNVTVTNVADKRFDDGAVAFDIPVTAKSATQLKYTVTVKDSKGSKTQPVTGTVNVAP